jgi:hypothetical protein
MAAPDRGHHSLNSPNQLSPLKFHRAIRRAGAIHERTWPNPLLSNEGTTVRAGERGAIFENHKARDRKSRTHKRNTAVTVVSFPSHNFGRATPV